MDRVPRRMDPREHLLREGAEDPFPQLVAGSRLHHRVDAPAGDRILSHEGHRPSTAHPEGGRRCRGVPEVHREDLPVPSGAGAAGQEDAGGDASGVDGRRPHFRCRAGGPDPQEGAAESAADRRGQRGPEGPSGHGPPGGPGGPGSAETPHCWISEARPCTASCKAAKTEGDLVICVVLAALENLVFPTYTVEVAGPTGPFDPKYQPPPEVR